MSKFFSASHLSASQGISETRTKMYMKYIEGELELITKQCAKNLGEVVGHADKQTKMVRS